MSWKVHETDEVFAALRGLCSNSYRMYDPCEHRYYYDHECDAYECAVEDAVEEYERLLRHCEKQREELAAIKNPLGKLKEAFMDNIDGLSKVRGSSITDELRECIATAIWQYENDVKTAYIPKDKLTAIADRIDAEHQKAVGRARMDGMDATFGNGWVKLPVDADGVPINVGDELTDGEDLPAKVRCMVLDESGWVVSTRELRGYGVLPATLRHVQPDSWVRIIRDAIAEGFERTDISAPCEVGNDELVERCRRLAGERA